MCRDADFNSAWARLSCFFPKAPPKRDFLSIYLTTFSESIISETQKIWGSPFFSSRSKFQLHFKNAAQNSEIVFCFWDNCIWIGIVKLSLLRTGYLPSTRNVLIRSTKIYNVNKRIFFEHNFFESDQWIRSRYCDEDLSSVWARLPCCLSKVPLKRAFLDIYLTTFSESAISEIRKLWGSSFFSKCSKFNLDFKNAAKNWENFFFSQIITSELVSLNFLS